MDTDENDTQEYNKKFAIYYSRDNKAIEWVSENWRFSIDKNEEEGKPFWVFVHKNIEDSDSGYFTERQLSWLKDILEK